MTFEEDEVDTVRTIKLQYRGRRMVGRELRRIQKFIEKQILA